jgi:hypothetical protein
LNQWLISHLSACGKGDAGGDVVEKAFVWALALVKKS